MYSGLFKPGSAGIPQKALVWPEQFPVLPQSLHTVTDFKLSEREKARMAAAVKDCTAAAAAAKQPSSDSKTAPAAPLSSTPLLSSGISAALKNSKRVLLSGAGGGYDLVHLSRCCCVTIAVAMFSLPGCRFTGR